MVAFSCSSRAVSASIPFCRSTIARCWRLNSRRFLSSAWTEMFPRFLSCVARFRSRASKARISRSRVRAFVSARRFASRSTIRALASASRASLSFSAERYSNSSIARITSPRRISPPSTRLGWISMIWPVTSARIWICRAANIFPKSWISGCMSVRRTGTESTVQTRSVGGDGSTLGFVRMKYDAPTAPAASRTIGTRTRSTFLTRCFPSHRSTKNANESPHRSQRRNPSALPSRPRSPGRSGVRAPMPRFRH